MSVLVYSYIEIVVLNSKHVLAEFGAGDIGPTYWVVGYCRISASEQTRIVCVSIITVYFGARLK